MWYASIRNSYKTVIYIYMLILVVEYTTEISITVLFLFVKLISHCLHVKPTFLI